MSKVHEKFRNLESGNSSTNNAYGTSRITFDFSGNNWLMERMRPGQGIEEGIHLLSNELSGNNFSWNAAHVPGDVYTDLYNAGELDDPFHGRNMGKAKWVQDYEWWYNYAFNVPEEMHKKDLTLIFEGIDYSCDVWLNGIHLGKHTGMMSSFQFDVTNLVSLDQPHVPSNLLTIKLDPPPKNQKNFAGLKHNFAGDYLTGVIPFGIWKPVKLIATDTVRIENFKVESSISENSADLLIDTEIFGLEYCNKELKVLVEVNDDVNTYSSVENIDLSHGLNNTHCKITIPDAKLWWPYELGTPFLYNISITILNGEIPLDSVSDKIGIREITMTKNPGFTDDEAEFPWTFNINGKPMFLRSACWGGQPSFFYGRNSVEKYRFYLEKAKECNINNLRIFGWHPIETKEFYDICDELGITVWNNFGFATQVFRDDKEYIDAVKKEVTSIVKEKRNHSSIVMWMGGEEVFFSEAHIKSGNSSLMKLIGEVTSSLTNVPYADASPLSSREAIKMGYKTKESAHANSHYYAAGAVFMENYYPYLDYCIIPELTAASSPNINSLKKFIPDSELWPIGLSWGYHAADIHILEILNYEVFGSKCNDTLENFVKSTQIAQGTIFQFALEHFRRCKPHVSGVSLCHFITNWPIIKWDIIDYYGEEKLSFDFVRKSYQPLLPSMSFKKRRWLPDEIFEGELWVINDYYKEYNNVNLSYVISNMKDEVVYEGSTSISIDENSSRKYLDINWKVCGNVGDTFNVSLKLTSEDNTVLSDNKYTLLIDNQELCIQKAKELYEISHDQREIYGRGYYRYTPHLIDRH
ncbi:MULTISPECIES: glycoside hydrolase family 2 protein [Bacteria]|uniref:glycoside hydrolase family 2 protein n=1 Tax=Bacteria TaxID=2 RepID=UPI0012B17AAE|nr:sugar-binding domain-containing protein [Clostridium beijerinckii]MRY42700.1 glycoside hydrolase family 2 [Parabacteroides distasonis]MZK52068.1 glycoside hydrolase family 2 [Clostridium beijerinckii]MZK60209.1 glycoside hydrolase family 2 [Clostridium beijerinckii]MZK70494.1 glycoside hydrolase family 2 [Clostridium beijerinckii]MZK75796.1 glycoside hydrolase family 2 [Clostridium beijerinckii]